MAFVCERVRKIGWLRSSELLPSKNENENDNENNNENNKEKTFSQIFFQEVSKLCLEYCDLNITLLRIPGALRDSENIRGNFGEHLQLVAKFDENTL